MLRRNGGRQRVARGAGQPGGGWPGSGSWGCCANSGAELALTWSKHSCWAVIMAVAVAAVALLPMTRHPTSPPLPIVVRLHAAHLSLFLL